MQSEKIYSFCVFFKRYSFQHITSIRMSLRSLGVELHCRCIQTESRPIGRHIEKVELIPANSHCEETEIIATLKKNGQEVCLDPEALWVKKIIQRIMSK
uniref:Chemokine interleukin-8-like domain-containing protein n=1 Tax=Xiphophorus couchianus TaxID=32473 RepID=A0A3B5MA79_9TELE